jgi:hypothetical protein
VLLAAPIYGSLVVSRYGFCTMISPARLWSVFLRDIKRGWSATCHHHWTLPRIQNWEWEFWGEQAAPVPVHVLTSGADWLLAAWMLASWFHNTGRNWDVTIHDDGTLPPDAIRAFTRMFRGSRVIPRSEADSVMKRLLTPFPFCAEYRTRNVRALKMFDAAHFAAAHPRFLLFDSDLLFFRRPVEIMDWIDAPANNECWFNEDARERSLISVREAASDLAVQLWTRVNTGLCLLQTAIVDLDFCDRALAETSIGRGDPARIESTLLALCASRARAGGLLPKTYEVSLARRAAPHAVSRHYTGTARDRFYAEGLARLRGDILQSRK